MTRWIITLLGALAASWPLAAHAQELMPPNTSGNAQRAADQDGAADAVDPAASKYQFRLGDGEVDLLKAFSLDGSDGIGSAWKVPSERPSDRRCCPRC